MKKRIQWVDIAKGIGILLVVLGHRGEIFDTLEIRIIYSFHMPLFFLLSGYVFNYDKFKSLKNFVIKKVKTLLIPYYCLYIISLGYYYFVVKNIAFDGVKDSIVKMLYATDGLINVPLWFIPCLFIVELLYYLLKKFSKSDKQLIISVCIFTMLGFFSYKIFYSRPPFSIDVAMYSILFFAIGNELNKINIDTIKLFEKWFLIIFFSGINIFINTKLILSGIAITAGVSIKTFVLFYFGALSGIFVIILIASTLKHNVILLFLGRNSIVILAFHMIVFDIIFKFQRKWNFLNFNISNRYMSALFYTVVTLVILLPIIFIIKKYIPFTIGRKREISKFNT